MHLYMSNKIMHHGGSFGSTCEIVFSESYDTFKKEMKERVNAFIAIMYEKPLSKYPELKKLIAMYQNADLKDRVQYGLEQKLPRLSR